MQQRLYPDSQNYVNSQYLIIFATSLFIIVKDIVSDVSVLQKRLHLFSSSSSCKQQKQQHKHCRHRPHPRQTVTHPAHRTIRNWVQLS